MCANITIKKEFKKVIMQRVTNVALYFNSALFHQYHPLLCIDYERENIQCG